VGYWSCLCVVCCGRVVLLFLLVVSSRCWCWLSDCWVGVGGVLVSVGGVCVGACLCCIMFSC